MSAHPNNTPEQKLKWNQSKRLRPSEIKDAEKLMEKARREQRRLYNQAMKAKRGVE